MVLAGDGAGAANASGEQEIAAVLARLHTDGAYRAAAGAAGAAWYHRYNSNSNIRGILESIIETIATGMYDAA